jgi:excisionase family DNA binding protein
MTAGARRRAPEDRGDPLDMSVAEAARILGISRTLAYDLVASGQLPSFRMGGRLRVPRRGVERLTEAREENDAGRAAAVDDLAGGKTVPAPKPESGPPTPRRLSSASPRRRRARSRIPGSITQLTLFDSSPDPPERESQPPTAPFSHPPSPQHPDPNSSDPLPSSTPERPTDICHPSGRALPERAPSGSEPGC